MGASRTCGDAAMGGREGLKGLSAEMWAETLRETRRKRPLVYSVTNFVAASFQANAALALGARPVMSRNPAESREIAAGADALVINTGTPTEESVEAIRGALSGAGEGKCILLDPVGYGASLYRKKLIDSLISEFPFSLIKGNAAEIALLAGEKGSMTGVDALLTASPAEEAVSRLSRQTGSLVCATGETDYLGDGKIELIFSGGSPYMPLVTGSGCIMGSLMAALSAGAGNDPAAGASCAIVLLRRAAEIADRKASGPGSFRSALLDAIFRISPEDLLEERNRMTVKEWRGKEEWT